MNGSASALAGADNSPDKTLSQQETDTHDRDREATGANNNLRLNTLLDTYNIDLHTSTSEDAMSESSVTPVTTTRKLPIPITPANSNASLKGILIKPKRILPAQPDNSKVRRPPQETAGTSKAGDTLEGVTQSGFTSNAKGGTESEETVKRVIIPKLEIDVDRLKLLFRVPVKENVVTAKAVSEKRNLIEDDISETINERDTQSSSRSENDCTLVSQPYKTRESTFYTCPQDGLSNVKEWCSNKDVNKMVDHDIIEPVDNGIRSSSPKSSTTWDRSSSGYSSDERPDPRSSPPIMSTCTVESNVKTVTQATNNDDDSLTTDRGTAIASTCDGDTNVSVTEPHMTGSFSESEKLTDINDETRARHLTEPPLTGCESEKETTQDKSDDHCQNKCNTIVNTSKQICDINSISHQIPRRPGWALNQPLPASGRIQYRKSSSESLISLRNQSKVGLANGLEVCGKSFSKTTATNLTRSHTVSNGSDKNDSPSRVDVSSPISAFVPMEKSVSPEMGAEISRVDLPTKELPMPVKQIRTKFAPSLTGYMDMKSLSMGINGPKDEKDIRKSLHDLNSPRRQTPTGKTLPIRARHTIQQPMNAIETVPGQPIIGSQTSAQRTGCDQGRPKFFGKKMWRAPSGQPENTQMRPFSPFGGTLPPSKLKEQECYKSHQRDGD